MSEPPSSVQTVSGKTPSLALTRQPLLNRLVLFPSKSNSRFPLLFWKSLCLVISRPIHPDVVATRPFLNHLFLERPAQQITLPSSGVITSPSPPRWLVPPTNTCFTPAPGNRHSVPAGRHLTTLISLHHKPTNGSFFLGFVSDIFPVPLVHLPPPWPYTPQMALQPTPTTPFTLSCVRVVRRPRPWGKLWM